MNFISLSSVTKNFFVTTHSKVNIIKLVASFISGQKPKTMLKALSNVTLSVHEGDIIGVIGKNGAGKSTLLKIVAGIYMPTNGNVSIRGHVVPITGIMNGYQDRLTAHENIYLTCTLLGLSKKEINARVKNIIAFAELETYTHTQLHQFSDGMRARLAFAIAIHSNPDILLLDEATNTADKDFIQKIEKNLRNLAVKGSIIMIASHDMDIIQKCRRVIWLEKGRIKKDHTGDVSKSIIKQYTL